ncbi:MAG TPA: FtsX-like permease family protein, partial [Deltaproteobacteria bacterium]|nr:FtsX-like permease family protein [Deltaproteobacteria bacterium]
IGHVQVHAPGYMDTKSFYRQIDDPEALLDAYAAAGLHASARLYASGLCARGTSSAGVVIRGVDPVAEARTTRMAGHILEGRWLDPHCDREVVLGRRLAQALSARIGDELVIVAQAADGSVANELFTVRGILKSVSENADRAGFFVTEKAFRDLMVMPTGAHEIVITTAMDADLAATEARVKGLSPGQDVRTWEQLLKAAQEMVASMEAYLLITLIITYVAIAIVTLNAMLMAVFERIREYGVTKALGVGPWDVFHQIMIETLIMASAAAVIGLAAGIPLTMWLETHGIDMSRFTQGATLSGIAIDVIWRAVLTPRVVLVPLVFLYLFSLLAALYPAAKAARLDPVKAIHHC